LGRGKETLKFHLGLQRQSASSETEVAPLVRTYSVFLSCQPSAWGALWLFVPSQARLRSFRAGLKSGCEFEKRGLYCLRLIEPSLKEIAVLKGVIAFERKIAALGICELVSIGYRSQKRPFGRLGESLSIAIPYKNSITTTSIMN